MNLKSLYICVRDINGFRFGLFAFEKKGEVHEFGSNCLPSLSVNSLTVLETKIEGKHDNSRAIRRGLIEYLVYNGWLGVVSRKYKTLVDLFEKCLNWNEDTNKWELK